MSTTFETHLVLSRPYLTRKQILRAQKNTISDRRTYNQKKLAVIKFLTDICVQLRFPRKTLEAAVYFYQRYHLFNNFETETCYSLATSCLLLSCKQVETLKKINDISTLSLRLRNIKVSPDILDNFKKRIFQLELRILEACNFDYRINSHVHIDEYIVKLGKNLNLTYEVSHTAWIIAYDVLKLDIILVVPQHTIAMAVLKIAYELHNQKTWPVVDYNKYETSIESVSEAYFDIVNFYINAFDLCDLKTSFPNMNQSLDTESFIELKKNAGPESGLKEELDISIDEDLYLTKQREYSVRERRYVLSAASVEEESSVLKNTTA